MLSAFPKPYQSGPSKVASEVERASAHEAIWVANENFVTPTHGRPVLYKCLKNWMDALADANYLSSSYILTLIPQLQRNLAIPSAFNSVNNLHVAETCQRRRQARPRRPITVICLKPHSRGESRSED